MCQFAQQEVDKWTNSSNELNDSLIAECLVLIGHRELPLQEEKNLSLCYGLEISFEHPCETQMRSFLKSLRSSKLGQIGEIFKKGHYQIIKLTNTSVMIKVCGSPHKVKELLVRCPQIRNVQIRKICSSHKEWILLGWSLLIIYHLSHIL